MGLCLCRLISQVAKEIWEVKSNDVKRWNGTIQEYKDHLRKLHDA